MPWLPLYADLVDLIQVLAWLNEEPDIAFLVPAGPQRWRAIKQRGDLVSGRYALWHVPSGPLPLMPAEPGGVPDVIADPWAGWIERRAAANPGEPWFGSGHPGILWLNARPQGTGGGISLGLSSFEWIGNYFWALGRTAPPSTERWWRRLRTWVKRMARRVPRRGPLDGPRPEVWAFPSAYRALTAGMPRDANPV